MNTYFALQFDGGPFKLFSPTHWAALIAILALNLFFVIWGKNFNQETRRIVRYSMAAVLVLNELAWHLWNWSVGRWTIQEMLPFHLFPQIKIRAPPDFRNVIEIGFDNRSR